MNSGPSHGSGRGRYHAPHHTNEIQSNAMTRLFKSSFLWQFAGGFVLGAVGLFTLAPTTDPVTGAPVEQVR